MLISVKVEKKLENNLVDLFFIFIFVSQTKRNNINNFKKYIIMKKINYLGFQIVIVRNCKRRYQMHGYIKNAFLRLPIYKSDNKKEKNYDMFSFSYTWHILRRAKQMIDNYYSNKIKELAQIAKQINFNAWVNSNIIIY